MSILTTVKPRDRHTQDKHRILMTMRGIPSTVPAEPVRAHLQKLVDLGVPVNAISRAASVSHSYPGKILSGEYSTITTRYASMLMSVDHRPHPAQEWVISVGAERRIQALRAIGWDTVTLSGHLEMDRGDVSKVGRGLITYGKWERIRDTYERLSVQRGPSQRAVNHARRNGWLLPMEWEGYDIDHPQVTPPRSVRSKRDDYYGPIAERREKVRELTRLGLSAQQISIRLGVSERQITRDRSAA